MYKNAQQEAWKILLRKNDVIVGIYFLSHKMTSIKHLVREWKENSPISDIIYNFTILPNDIVLQGSIQNLRISEPIPYHYLPEDDLNEYYLVWMNILSVDSKSFVARLTLLINQETRGYCHSMHAFGITPITYRSRIELFAAALDNVNVPEITEALSRDIMYEIPITENMDILMEPAADAEMRAMSAMKNAAATADA